MDPNDGMTDPEDTPNGDDTATDDEGGQDTDTDKGGFAFNGPMILLISFGGTAVLIGIGVGVYFLIAALRKKAKAKNTPTEE